MSDATPCANHHEHTEAYCKAHALLSRHTERMGRQEGAAQLAAHLAAGRRRKTFGTGRRHPFRPSATLLTACAMLGDPTLTPERALGFIHDPSAAAFETERRMRGTG